MKKSHLLGAVWIYVSALILVPSLCHSFPSYYVTDLGTLGTGNTQPGLDYSLPLGMNDSGSVVGYSYTGTTDHAFLWSSTAGMADLGVIDGKEASFASDINNAGQVTGYVRNYGGPGSVMGFIWDDANGMSALGSLGEFSYGIGINDYGQITGKWGTTGSGSSIHSFLWGVADGMSDLGNLPEPFNSQSQGNDVNNLGQVVGYGLSSTGQGQAYLWDNINGMQGLGTLDGLDDSFSMAINSEGQILGYSDGFGLDGRAWIWDSEIGMTDIGSLGGSAMLSRGINDIGQAVGESVKTNDAAGWLWDSSLGLLDLNDLIDPSDPLYGSITILGAMDINNNGQIVAYALIGDALSSRGILLTPTVSSIPIPPAVWLFGSGLLGLVGIARRKKAT